MTEPTIQEIERQIRWEVSSINDGVRRYRETIAKSSLADTPPGHIALMEMMGTPDKPGLIAAIEEARQEAISGIANSGRGPKPQWWWLIGFLSAEKLAFITVRTILTHISQRGDGHPVTSIALNIGTSIKTEMEFEQWAEDEKRRAKEDPSHVNLFRLITSKAKKVDARAFERWKKKLTSIRRERWTSEQKIQVGTKLLDLAIKHGGGWIEYRMVFLKGKTEHRVFLSDLAKAAINDINAKLEVQRPYLLPMICPPKPWRREENANQHSDF